MNDGINPFLPGCAIVCNFVSSLPETQFKSFKVPHDPYHRVFGMYLQIFNEYYFTEVKIC